MEISELLSFKPEQTPKRQLDGDEETEKDAKPENVKAKKSKKMKSERPDDSSKLVQNTPTITKEQLDILSLLDDDDPTDAGDALDEAGLKKMMLLFEKRVLKNQEMRIKFPEQPEKFMDSEIDLHEVIQQLNAVSTCPDLYPLMVELNGIPSLLELLSHPNTDISVSVVNLIQELTDIDILHESMEGAEKLIEALRKQQACGLLVQNLERLDETIREEAEGVHNTLNIFENLTEILPEMCEEIASQGLISWILKRMKAKLPFDANKLYCSEMLSILLQNTNENRILLGTSDGIDILLQQLANYKRQDPSTSEEQEFMENLFNCLCSSLMAKQNREMFLKGEGLQLMNLMLREKKLSRNGALKVLDFALSGPDGKDNCNKFVDILGLRTIFPLFMKTPKKNKKRLLSSDQHEEYVVSIIASMLRNCKGPQKQRLLGKFAENDFEKVDRLLELHLKYLEKVENFDRKIDEQRQIDEDEDDDDAIYVQRLSGGLFTLQLIDYIVLEISVSSTDSAKIKQRLNQILSLRGASMKTIRHVMREYAGNLGDAGDKDWRDQEQQHILSLVDRF